MLIHCTQALLDRLALEPRELESPHGYERMPQALMAWHAGLITLDRRKVVVFMNNATRVPR